MIAVRRRVVETVAERVGIRHPALQESDELLTAIRQRDAALYDLLDAHLRARQEWFEFHYHIEVAGKTGQLDRDESERLTTLVTRKQETGQALARRLS